MNPDFFNMQVRKFLKQVGVTSQREIENAVKEALQKGEITDDKPLAVRMTLTIEAVGLTHIVEDEIGLQ